MAWSTNMLSLPNLLAASDLSWPYKMRPDLDDKHEWIECFHKGPPSPRQAHLEEVEEGNDWPLQITWSCKHFSALAQFQPAIACKLAQDMLRIMRRGLAGLAGLLGQPRDQRLAAYLFIYWFIHLCRKWTWMVCNNSIHDHHTSESVCGPEAPDYMRFDDISCHKFRALDFLSCKNAW